MAIIKATYKYNVIYVCKVDDERHRGALKIGRTEIETDAITSQSLTPNCEALQKVAHNRIREYTQTAGVNYELLYVEKAHFMDKDGNENKFIDDDIHAVLLASGYKRHYFADMANQPKDWFDVDFDTVMAAIAALKEGRSSIRDTSVKNKPEIHFREEQEDAINRTQTYLNGGKNRKMLWNAKMRFGKTLCSLELIRRCGYKRTLILTHRPTVKEQWFDDYANIRFDNYEYGSKPGVGQKTGQKHSGQTFKYLKSCGYNFIYFASMQDLRGSWNKNGVLKKNQDVFDTKWDLVIIDEAHEGTLTELGQLVIKSLDKQKPRFLYLSGTPYNILHLFTSEEVYTWDYVMEQKAKEEWPKKHPNEPNPYEGLAHLNILTYNLGTTFQHYNHSDEDYFEFSEFFRTWAGDKQTDKRKMPEGAKIGDFIHGADVWEFLNLLCKEDPVSNYPYSTEDYRNCFAHTLWVLPGVNAAAALSKMLRRHPYFQDYKVVNVAGEGDKIDNTDDEYEKSKATTTFQEKVQNAIKHNPRTITLTCYSGRLTTGVTIEEWTGVFMLAGGYRGNIAPYMQTIFRVQSPIKHHDYIKKECYAFDYAPDRTLTVINDYISGMKKHKGKDGRKHPLGALSVETFTHFCSIIAIDGSKTIDYNAGNFITRVNHVYADHVIRHGGRDHRLYTNYDNITPKDFDIIGEIAESMRRAGYSGKSNEGTDIPITDEGMTGENATQPQSGTDDNRNGKKGTGRKKKTSEEERRKSVFDTLDMISIRLPLMVFGSVDNVTTVSFKKFIQGIDSDSWNEFMPKGLDKEKFLKISHLYNNDVFIATATEIVSRAKHADSLPITRRTQAMAAILSLFHYPDKETVLTPWNTVCRHVSDTLGGWDFFNEKHEKGHPLAEPRFVDNGKVTSDVFADPQTKILELNSKSGVYPLFLAYSVFRERIKPPKTMFGEAPLTDSDERKIWRRVIEDNIYVVCKTPMAQKITRRVLAGYDKTVKLNTVAIDDIISRMKNKQKSKELLEKLTRPRTYGSTQKNTPMKFKAIVSNPPYQIKDGGAGASATPVYNLFVDLAKKLNPEYISIIMPAKWYNDGKGLAQFRTDMLHDRRIEKLVDYVDEHVCFPGVDVAGGVCYFLWDKNHDGDCRYTNVFKDKVTTIERNLADGDRFIRYAQAVDILKKVKETSIAFYDTRVSTQKPFGLRTYVAPLPSGDIVLKTSKGKGAYDSSLITVGNDMINKWKVIISYLTAEHAGQTDKAGLKKILSSLDILAPGEICTETYLVVDSFETKAGALALAKYLCTRFVRFLIGILAATQHLSKDKFGYVPVQDFSSGADIHWDGSVAEIETELYDKYGLSAGERKFIQSMIKPMTFSN